MYLQIDNALKTVTRLKNLFQMLFLEKLKLIKRGKRNIRKKMFCILALI